MAEQVKEQNINITLAPKSEPIFKIESEDINAKLVKDEVNYHLEKHPEIKIFFESTYIKGGGGSIKVLSQEEYDAFPSKELTTIFLIIENGDLSKIYFGTVLVAQKDENGVFPYSFPIIF